jgi:hypothetical protein
MKWFLVLVLLVATSVPAYADEDVSVSDVIIDRAQAHGVSASAMLRLANCESRMDPRAVGRQGEIGLMQLAPFGLLPLFYQRGHTNPWSAYQQADFTAWAISSGLAGHWSCWWIGAGHRPPWWS